jgi:hypothetical protein
MALDQVRQPVHEPAAFGRSRFAPRPAIESFAGSSHGAIYIGGIGFSHLADDLSRGRIDGGKGLAGRAIHPLIIDEEFGR